jgi:predicted ATP-grasp superfamily ATP-dependent carboligase
MARAIVTFARGWQALAITRSLGHRGIEVYTGEESSFAPCFFSRYSKGSFIYPSVSDNPEGFLDFMEKKVRELKPPDGEPYVLIPVHKETWLLAKHRDRFEPHISLPLTSFENMALTHDKGRLPDLANELGIRIPETHRFTDLDEMEQAIARMSFPRFLKVREGASGVGLRKVNSATEAIATYREFVEGMGLTPESYPLVQEFVEGDDYCVTTLFDHGRCVAKMTYRNVRAFPRDTGAGALREAVPMEDAEAEAVRLLEHLNWHGIAELDFRKAEGGPAYLIEVNPRIFGGLPQAVAANVDYPWLLWRIACGEKIEDSPEVDYSVRTETPVTGLLATLDEIAHDDEVLDRMRRVRAEVGKVAYGDVRDVKLRPLFDSLKQLTDPKDVKAYLTKMFEKHHGAIDDVLHRDDPAPALGFLYPVALALKHGGLSMTVLTGEADVEKQRPRIRLRDLLRRPTWRALWATALLYTFATFFMNWQWTQDNLGWLLAWPGRLIATVVGDIDPANPIGALKQTASHVLNLMWLYLVAALLLREPRTIKSGGKETS